jgi:hypothetical protein
MLLAIVLLAMAPDGAFSASLSEEARTKGLSLTAREERVLEVGVVPRINYLLGGAVGTWPVGLGTGHMVQGRWRDTGWKFTVAQLGALGMVLASGDCAGKLLRNDDNECTGPNEVLMLSGLFAFVGLRLWEIYDVWAVPPRENARYRKLEERIRATEVPAASLTLAPLVRVGASGVTLRLDF